MSTEKAQINKLNGTANYSIWAIKMRALFIKNGLSSVIHTDNVDPELNDKAIAEILLCLEDGPLMQVHHLPRAHQIWLALNNLYSPQGFSSEFLILKEFFSCKLSKFNCMEEYLNTIKRLNDDLSAKDIKLPKQVVVAWVLSNLTSKYEVIVTSIMQSLRINIDSYSIESLFSNLLDESKRQKSNEDNNEQALAVLAKPPPPSGYKGKKPYKITKGKYCRGCNKTTHNTVDCFHLFPHKAPKNWKPKVRTFQERMNTKVVKPLPDETDILCTRIDTSLSNLNDDMHVDLDNDQVMYCTIECNQEHKSNKTLDLKSNRCDSHANKSKFILDTAATKHIVCDRQYLSNYRECNKIVRWGNAKSIQINGFGDLYLKFSSNSKVYLLKDCFYMPQIGMNIISHSELQGNVVSIFSKDTCEIRCDNQIIAKGEKINNLYYMCIDYIVMPEQVLNITDPNSSSNTSKDSIINIEDLHRRFGHVNPNCLSKIIQNTNGYSGSSNVNKADLKDCEICLQGKFTNKINRSSSDKEFPYLGKVSSDICGPISPNTFDNYRYFVTFLDTSTRYLEVKLLRSKDEAIDAFQSFLNLYENNANNKRVRILATDNGTEYTNKRFKALLNTKGITHQLSPVYTKEPNGIVERVNRTLMDKVRCLLANAKLPNYFWGEACLTATYLYNRTPHSSLDFKTPFEAKNNLKPDISHIRTFGSMCFYKNKGNNIKKLDDKALKGILIGFNDRLYKVFDISARKCIWVRDIHIMENKFVNLDENKPKADHFVEIPLVGTNSAPITNQTTQSTSDVAINPNSNPKAIEIGPDPIQIVESSNDVAESLNATNNNITRPAIKIAKSQPSIPIDEADDLDELALMVNINNEPKTYKEAVASIQSKDWHKAMQAEVDELESQGTWDVTDLPSDKHPLKGRWVYKLKTDINGEIIKYKARWVVKGYNQVLGVDYLDTFSTTCRPESYRIVFVLAVHNSWHLNQYDVKNAFIHAKIDKEIYVEQPTGFEKPDARGSKRYCKLNKALYGLKQSPRLWYEHLRGVLRHFGFIPMPYDSAVFVHRANQIIIVCHVDDLIITGPDQRQIDQIIAQISKKIKLEKIGNIHQFLGMQIETDYQHKVIKINQNKYTSSLLQRFEKETVVPVSSPVELGINLEKATEEQDKKLIQTYQQQVGSLIYLAINTRPDIAYAVNRCARFMANPNQSHFRALERVWKYLNKYPNLGLYYDCSKISQNILGYTDADWGGDTITRKSTSGYIFLLNNNIISWSSMQQKTVALSSCEAEYMAFKEAIKESIYLNNLFKYYLDLILQIDCQEIPRLLTDSESAMKLANNPEFHKRSKHIDISYHFIRNTIAENQIKLLYVKSKDQKADGFTKGLDTLKHKSFLLSLNLR